MPAITPLPLLGVQRLWKNPPGEPVGDAGDPYTGYDRLGRTERLRWDKLADGGSFSPFVDVTATASGGSWDVILDFGGDTFGGAGFVHSL